MLDKNVVEMLNEWRTTVAIHQQEHFKKAGKCKKYHMMIGLPATVLVVITTGLILWDLDVNKTSAVVSAALSFIATILVAIQTFFEYAKNAAKHQLISSKYGDVRKEIELLLSLPPKAKSTLEHKLTVLKQKISEISDDAPLLEIEAITRNPEKPRDRDDSDIGNTNSSRGPTRTGTQSSGSDFGGPIGGGFKTSDSDGRPVYLPYKK